jgi:osmoprotectant transport system ATP-binding protein
MLEQYDTPSELLSKPANAFVTEFIGSDRGIKRLTVTGIDMSRLEPTFSVDFHPEGPSVPSSATMRDALAALLDGGTGWVAITDGDEVAGVLTATSIAEASAVA